MLRTQRWLGRFGQRNQKCGSFMVEVNRRAGANVSKALVLLMLVLGATAVVIGVGES